MPLSRIRLLHRQGACLGALTLALAFAGCALPRASYKKIDQDTPAFKAAVALETERLQTTEKSVSAATKLATKRVTQQFIDAEKQRRTEQVAPLAEVMAVFEKPRGCWAYTITTTQRTNGVPTVTVETFDPFQPEERLWTLVSRDAQTPDEKAQATYRAKKLRDWRKKQDRKPKEPESERMKWRALSAHFAIESPENSPHTTFVFARDNTKIALLGETGAFSQSFVVDPAARTLVQRTMRLLSPAAVLAGSTKIDRFETTTHYAIVDHALPPFVAKTTARYRGHFFGQDTGDVELEAVYSDYRRVKCYDDRFEVKVGPPGLVDFLPTAP